MGRRRRTPTKVGRRTLLDEDTFNRLEQVISAGAPYDKAAEYVGIGTRTLFDWIARGRAEVEHREDGGEPNPDEDLFADFATMVTRARSRAHVSSVVALRKAIEGGQVIEETVREYRDPDTGAKVKESTVKRTAPDWRAASWFLERQDRANFGKGPEQVELSGPGGGPVELTANVEDLAARVAANLAALAPRPPAAIEGDITDAEVVDEEGPDLS